jgi:hypothetical protein
MPLDHRNDEIYRYVQIALSGLVVLLLVGLVIQEGNSRLLPHRYEKTASLIAALLVVLSWVCWRPTIRTILAATAACAAILGLIVLVFP